MKALVVPSSRGDLRERVQMGSMGAGSQTATVSPLAKYKLVFLGDQSVGKFYSLSLTR